MKDAERSRSPNSYPNVGESFARLHRAGWSIGETAFGSDPALVWIVAGTNGENRVEASGRCQAEAWYRATLQAEAVGMLALTRAGLYQFHRFFHRFSSL